MKKQIQIIILIVSILLLVSGLILGIYGTVKYFKYQSIIVDINIDETRASREASMFKGNEAYYESQYLAGKITYEQYLAGMNGTDTSTSKSSNTTDSSRTIIYTELQDKEKNRIIWGVILSVVGSFTFISIIRYSKRTKNKTEVVN